MVKREATTDETRASEGDKLEHGAEVVALRQTRVVRQQGAAQRQQERNQTSNNRDAGADEGGDIHPFQVAVTRRF